MRKMSHIEAEIAVHKSHCFTVIMDEDYGCKYGPDSECPNNKKMAEVIEPLGEIERSVLLALSDVGYDLYVPYSYLESETKYDRKVLKPIIKKLRLLGLVDYKNGLMDDEGQVAGSGFSLLNPSSVRNYFEDKATFNEVLQEVRTTDPWIKPDSLDKIRRAHEQELAELRVGR